MERGGGRAAGAGGRGSDGVQRLDARGPPGGHRAGAQREQQSDGEDESRLGRREGQSAQGSQTVGEEGAECARAESDHRRLIEDEPENLRSAPADTAQGSELGAPGAYGGQGGLSDEQCAHHQDQGEQDGALAVHRLEDSQGDSLGGPVLGDLDVLRQRDRLRRRGTAHGHVDLELGAGGADLSGDGVDAGAGGGVPQAVQVEILVEVGVPAGSDECLVDRPRGQPADPLGEPQSGVPPAGPTSPSTRTLCSCRRRRLVSSNSRSPQAGRAPPWGRLPPASIPSSCCSPSPPAAHAAQRRCRDNS